ncbi:hypothetical protein B1A99_15435 [Cohnella sp. CIP 111063]|uniref:cache domain-containing sensor histidine kinase n=1 Tax=unclassified Cohnella TaxID=2636738 RepID=UPI000B8C38BD|nr:MULTISPECIES: histidine kinase [unclassified Cohnella]OXS58021.1 hypothetical protein B1A99_15435 [Cohnella sp. CIP 111063]PRX71356.1 two-component system sensor histidine kinase YesM [Cohnella sp. SGD-V74]
MFRAISSSIKWKFVSLMIVVILLTVSVIGIFSYRDTSRTLQRDIEHFSEQILKQASFNLSRYYQSYEQGFLLLGSSAEVRDWMSKSSDDTSGKAFTYYKITDNYILPLMSRHNEILSISLLSDKGNEIHVENGYYFLNKDYSLSEEHWLETVRATDKLYVEVGLSEHYKSRDNKAHPIMVMSMAKQLGRINNGLIKMDIALEPVQNILREINLGENGNSMVINESNEIIVHPDDSRVGSRLPEEVGARIANKEKGWFFLEETREMVIFGNIDSTAWKTIAIIPFDDMNKSIIRVRNVTIATALIALIMSSLLVVWLTSSVTNRLTNLRRIIKRTKLGNIGMRAPVGGNDEVADLGVAYNQMLDRLDETIHALAVSKSKQQQATMTALQSQINSHFLYNTLESINSMANLVNHREIERAAINLSKMLRYTSNYENSLVQLQKEFDHTNHYLEICRLRFSDRIAHEFRVAEECRELLCLKAILQPIVENSLKHGIEKTGQAIRIVISAEMEQEHVVIKVSDNGPGYSQEALQQLRERLAIQDAGEAYRELSRVGLLNVQYRIRMFDQHKDSGLHVYNEPNGAVTELRFLRRQKRRVNPHATSSRR